MVNGVVGSNAHRKLNVAEFQGFALSSEFAPIAFINGNDSRAAKTFTLLHEIAHLWLGQSALDDADQASQMTRADGDAERWCSQVASRVLVPRADLIAEHQPTADLSTELDRLARLFKASTLTILGRLREAGYLSQAEFWDAYDAELARVRSFAPSGSVSSGNFCNTQPARVSKRFARAVIASTLEGQTAVPRRLPDAGLPEGLSVRRTGAQAGGRVMAYLLDANVFIQAKNLHYGLDFCPAFWDWLDQANAAGTVFSIEKVSDELKGGADDLPCIGVGAPRLVPLARSRGNRKPSRSERMGSQRDERRQVHAGSTQHFLQVADYYSLLRRTQEDTRWSLVRSSTTP